MSSDSQIFYINSEHRTSGSSSNFTFELPIKDNAKYDRVSVLQLSIPLSFYLIRPPYDTFTLTEDDQTVSITIPPGNYNIRTFSDKIVELLNLHSPKHFIYAMTFDIVLAKFTYSVTGNLSIQPIIGLKQHLSDQFGFEFQSQNQFVDNKITSTRVVNFVSGNNTVFLHSTLVDDQTMILQEVYSSNTIPFSFITWINPNKEMYSKKLKSNTDTFFNFTITDDDNIEIDLNGQNVFITVLLWKQDDLSVLFKKYLKLQLMKLAEK